MSLNEIQNNIIADKNFRINLTQKDFAWFFTVYFKEYIDYEISDLHKDMFRLLTDTSKPFKIIVTFRGSGKSTIASLAYLIWAILGSPKKKHIIICSNTQPQAKLILENVKTELEKNKMLVHDYGKFQYSDELWRADTLVLPKYGARVSIASVGTSIRGVRHGKYRPDLIILDDAESSESVLTKEGRDRVSNWLDRDLIPAGDKDTNVIVLGNLLHNDDLINRLIKRIEIRKLDGDYIKVPLIDSKNRITWKGKFPSLKDIEKEKQRVGDDKSFRREYLLQIVPDDEQIITEDMIKYYEELPDEQNLIGGLVAVDLAISKKESADNTAILGAYLYEFSDKKKLYLLPYLVNMKLNFHEALDKTKEFVDSMETKDSTYIYSENVGYQSSFSETLLEEGYLNAEPFEIKGQDKRSRLSTTVHPLTTGKILFPKKGLNLLLNQLFGFGVEKHDDLADSFSMLVNKAFSKDFNSGGVMIVRSSDVRGGYLPSLGDNAGFSIQFPH